jgi:hypothetical protein
MENITTDSKEQKNTISSQINTITENTDFSLVTVWVKLISNVLLITLPFLPLVIPLAAIGGKKTKKYKRTFAIKK